MSRTEEAIQVLKEKFGDRIVETKLDAKDPWVRVEPKDLVDVMLFCRDEPRLKLDLLSCLSTVDYPKEGRIEVIYNLDSIPQNHGLTVKVYVSRDDSRLPTLENVWRTADWHEREAWDLMGIRFEGHHNLVRILCAEDWEGHPLRKDYVMPEYYHGIPNAFEQFYDVQNP